MIPKRAGKFPVRAFLNGVRGRPWSFRDDAEHSGSQTVRVTIAQVSSPQDIQGIL